MFGRYARLFRIPGVGPTLGFGLLAKLPMTAVPIVLTLHVLGLHRGLAAAGFVTGCWLAGLMIGAPVQGFAVDRFGVRRVMFVSACAQGVFWAVAGMLAFPALVVATFLSGLLLVPGSTPIRLALTTRVPAADRQSGFAVDSMLTEVSYMTGPAIGVLLTTGLSSRVAMLLIGGTLTLGLATLAAVVPATKSAPVERTGRLSVVSVGLVAALGCAFFSGSVTAGFEISIVGLMNAQHAVAWIGLVTSVVGAYALAGGLVFGTLRTTVPAWLATLLLGLATIPVGLVSDWRLLFLTIAPAAALSAAAFSTSANTATRLAPPDKRGRVVGLYGAALAGGNALGAPLAGAANTLGGAEAGFALVGVLAVLMALVASRARERVVVEPELVAV